MTPANRTAANRTAANRIAATGTAANRTGTAERPRPPSPPVDRAVAVEAVRALARTARSLERAAGDLGMPQYRVLSAIAAGEERASRVAERFQLGRPTVSVAVDALCRDGLVRRTGTAGDQRAFDLAVTPAGRAKLERVENEMVRVLSDLCARAADGAPERPGSDVPAPGGAPGGAPAGSTGDGRSHARVLEALASLGPAVDARLAERRGRRPKIAR